MPELQCSRYNEESNWRVIFGDYIAAVKKVIG